MPVKSPRCTIRQPPSRRTIRLTGATILAVSARKSVPAVWVHDLRRGLVAVVCEDFFGSQLQPESVPRLRRPLMRQRPAGGLAIHRKPGIANQGSPRYRGLRPCLGLYTSAGGKESMSLPEIPKFMVVEYSRID